VTAPLLTVTDLHVRYGSVRAVQGVCVDLPQGEMRVLLGANGAGKSTVTRAILGLVKAERGSVRLRGVELLGLRPHEVHRVGVAWVPQGRQLWGSLTVLENLRLAADRLGRAVADQRIEAIFERFPRLRERQRNLAGALSGGEQQMVAIGRALVSEPEVILMDEPTLGLAPKVVAELFTLVGELRDLGLSILMAEQNARQALKMADWGYVLEGGTVAASGPARDLAQTEEVQDIYLGGKA
jgi:branched-chain amino acid transport system ATP-binding protein